MSKRLQVVIGDDEFVEVQRAADDEGLSVSGWVRKSLRQARRQTASADLERRLAAVRVAAAYSFPVGEVEDMLAEIERGYLSP